MKRNDLLGHRGQILLITLLVLTVATTIALSLIGRATLDLSISNQLEESTRAFSAAEAGLEQALKAQTVGTVSNVLTPGVSYTTITSSITAVNGVYTLTHQTPRDVTETVWLADHTDATTIDYATSYKNPSIDICWSQGTTTAGLVVSVLYRTGAGTFQVARAAYDPTATSRNNNFTYTGITQDGCGQSWYRKTLSFQADLNIDPLTNDLIALRIRPVYADTTIAVGGNVPKQGYSYDSTGQTGTGVTRRVVVYQQYRSAQSIFDSVIYSQAGPFSQ